MRLIEAICRLPRTVEVALLDYQKHLHKMSAEHDKYVPKYQLPQPKRRRQSTRPSVCWIIALFF